MNKKKQKQIKEIMEQLNMPSHAEHTFKKLNAYDIDFLYHHVMHSQYN